MEKAGYLDKVNQKKLVFREPRGTGDSDKVSWLLLKGVYFYIFLRFFMYFVLFFYALLSLIWPSSGKNQVDFFSDRV